MMSGFRVQETWHMTSHAASHLEPPLLKDTEAALPLPARGPGLFVSSSSGKTEARLPCLKQVRALAPREPTDQSHD